MTDTTEVANIVMQVLDRVEICLQQNKLESKINPRILAEEGGGMGFV